MNKILIPLLLLGLVVVLMIPITSLVINREEPDYLNSPLYELNGHSLNDLFDSDAIIGYHQNLLDITDFAVNTYNLVDNLNPNTMYLLTSNVPSQTTVYVGNTNSYILNENAQLTYNYGDDNIYYRYVESDNNGKIWVYIYPSVYYEEVLNGTYSLMIEYIGTLPEYEFNALQLVTNGDFSNGTIGWYYYANGGNPNLAVSDGIGTFTGTSPFAIGQYNKLIQNDIYYFITKAKGSIESTFNAISYEDASLGQIIALTSLTTAYQNISVVFTHTSPTTDNFGFGRTGVANTVNVDFAYLFNVSTLIDNRQYSNIYDTTFDLMTNEQIKIQIDTWINNGALSLDIQENEPTYISTLSKVNFLDFSTTTSLFEQNFNSYYMNHWVGLEALGLESVSVDQLNYFYQLYIYYSNL